MIISKASLQIIELTKGNKKQFGQLCIEPDGSVVVWNGAAIVAVSPVSPAIVRQVGIEVQESEDAQIVLSIDTVQSILKSIPKDVKYKTLLEHCDVSLPDLASPQVKVLINDGKQISTITVRRSAKTFYNYKAIFKQLNYFRNLGSLSRTALNRKRWSDLALVLDKACPYSGEFSPVYWQFIGENILVRAINELTGQRILAYFKPIALTADQWPVLERWEKGLLGNQ